MVDYTPTWNLPYPAAADSVQPESRDFEALAIGVSAALTQAKGEAIGYTDASVFWRGTVTGGVDLNTLQQPGSYGVLGDGANRPPGETSGTVIVSEMATGAAATTVQLFYGQHTRALYSRTRSGVTGTWTGWGQINAWQNGGTLTGSENLDTIVKPGVYGALTTGANRPPGEASGILTVAEMATGAAATTVQTWYGTFSRALFTRIRSGVTGTWTAWDQINTGRERRVPVALTRPMAASTETATSRSLRIPFSVGARVHRWRVVIRNANYRTNTIYPGTATIRTLATGQAQRDPATGALTSSYAAAPAIRLRNITNVDLGAGWSSGWMDGLEPGVDYMIGLGYETSGQTVHLGMGGGWWTNGNPMNAELTNDPTAAAAIRLPFDIRIEAMTAHDVPVDLVIGDSIAAGSNATLPVREAPAAIAARDTGRMIRTHAFGGAQFSEWIGPAWGDPASIKWRDVTDYGRVDRVFLALGNNDINGGMNLPTLQARFADMVALIRERVSAEIVACTVTPRTAWTSTPEVVRTQFNDWLRTYPHGITGVADMAAAVEDATGSNPRADFVVGDGIHFNTAGSTALAAAITRPVTTERTDRDTGWRELPGGTKLRRVGEAVYVQLYGNLPAGTGTVDVDTLPVGYRPKWHEATSYFQGSNTFRCHLMTTGVVRFYDVASSGQFVTMGDTYSTTDPWPTTLPGTAA